MFSISFLNLLLYIWLLFSTTEQVHRRNIKMIHETEDWIFWVLEQERWRKTLLLSVSRNYRVTETDSSWLWRARDKCWIGNSIYIQVNILSPKRWFQPWKRGAEKSRNLLSEVFKLPTCLETVRSRGPFQQKF